jgi:hypothetical protein
LEFFIATATGLAVAVDDVLGTDIMCIAVQGLLSSENCERDEILAAVCSS